MKPTRFARTVALAATFGIAFAACDKSVSQRDPYADAIRQRLASAATAAKKEKDPPSPLATFYEGRHHAPAWFTGKGRDTRTAAALEILQRADDHGLSRTAYHERSLRDRVTALAAVKDAAQRTAETIADLDVALTAAVLQLGADVATGAAEPAVIDRRWNTRRELPDLAAALEASLDAPDEFLDRVRPVHPEYHALQKALFSLRAQTANGWPSIGRVSVRAGQTHAAVPRLRQRLAAEGYLAADKVNGSTHVDSDVTEAVERFQEHHGLPPTGTLDAATLEALDVPLDTRVAQVAMNLERWRWLPDDLGARHFLVNIPYFHLIAREHGKPVMDMRVVVGKPGNETPTFSDEMTQVVFSPYWNIPETIALEETAPAIARDPDYLTRNNMEVVNASGRVVSAGEIPWDDERALRGLSFRQRPGANNALGYVKFLFPNEHNVYIHDTPADALFSRIRRAFSHGCVRVEEPEALAQYVLRDRREWTPEAIVKAMRAGEEQHVKLETPIPVHIVYMTAWVDDQGGLHFQKDIYGYDAAQSRTRAREVRASD